jgi:hypothetical protein
MKIDGRAELDRLRCRGCGGGGPAHEPIVLHSRCHPESPAWLSYNFKGVLELRCAKCDRVIGAFWVGEAPPS